MESKRRAFILGITSSVILVLFFIVGNQLFATLWILILPIGFFVITFFLAATISNIQFWVRKRKDLNFTFLPLVIQAITVLIIVLMPSHDRSKQHHLWTVSLPADRKINCPCSLYLEYYTVFGQGAFGTDLNSEYLTDSLNFRKYLGTYDEGNERINISCKGDVVTVIKTSSEFVNTSWSDPQILERNTYSLSDLKKNHIFE